MNLYLYNQKRNRDLNEYLNKLQVEQGEFNRLNQNDRHLLLVGGGMSVLNPAFEEKTAMKITNIDLEPPGNNNSDRILNIRGDFTKIPPYINKFDEIWALYSLPLYSPNKVSVFMFILKAILAIKPGGIIRFFPLEFDGSMKMNTRDADYDMTTMECTNTVLKTLKKLEELGIKCTRIKGFSNDKERIQETVVLRLDDLSIEKEKINSLILHKIIEYKIEDNITIVKKLNNLE